MHVVRDERCLDSTKQSIEHNTNREKEARCHGVNARQGCQNRRSTGEQHGRDQDVSHQTEDDEDDVDGRSVSGVDDFQESMGIGGSSFELYGQCREQDDLDGCTCACQYSIKIFDCWRTHRKHSRTALRYHICTLPQSIEAESQPMSNY